MAHLYRLCWILSYKWISDSLLVAVYISNTTPIPCVVFYHARTVLCTFLLKFKLKNSSPVDFCSCWRIFKHITTFISAFNRDLTRTLLHINVQINQCFFAFCFLAHQLKLASLNLNSKYIGFNLFSVLRPLKSSLLSLLIRSASKSLFGP